MELRSFKMSVTIYQSKPQRHESAAQGIRIIQSNTSFLKLLRIIQSNTSFLKWCFRLNNSYTLWIKYHIGMNNVESSVYSVIRMCSLQMLYVSLLWPCLLQTLGYLSSFFLAERKLRWPSLPLLLSPLHSATHLPASRNRIPFPLLGNIFTTSQPINRHSNGRSNPQWPIYCFLIQEFINRRFVSCIHFVKYRVYTKEWCGFKS